MRLIVFQKMFRNLDSAGLIRAAHDWGVAGYDLCIRPGYLVNPDNAQTALPELAGNMRKESLDIPLITAPGDLLSPDSDDAGRILRAMDAAGIRLLKIGYFRFNPGKQDYWQEISKIRNILKEWEKTARDFNVKICLHTHSNYCFGYNGASMMHLLDGFDPENLGAYADTGHLALEGGNFDMETAMMKEFLSAAALKDMIKSPPGGDGLPRPHIKAAAGKGLVCWSLVFSELARLEFRGPLSIHFEFLDGAKTWDPQQTEVLEEINFFKKRLSGPTG